MLYKKDQKRPAGQLSVAQKNTPEDKACQMAKTGTLGADLAHMVQTWPTVFRKLASAESKEAKKIWNSKQNDVE